MPTPAVYVPIVKSHEGEGRALSELTNDVRTLIAPLIEVSRAHASKLADLLPHMIAKRLTEFVVGNCGSGEVSLELGPLLDRPDGDVISRELAYRLNALRTDARLVIRLGDEQRYLRLAAARKLFDRTGGTLRITRTEYVSTQLSNLRHILRTFNLDPGVVDLLVDRQLVDEDEPMMGTVGRLEADFNWRSITYVGGSFPQDLSDLGRNDQHELPRHEWQTFTREQSRSRRRVRYGDYTVQHPFQRDPLPPVLPSGSIRYASDRYWVVMRGEKLDRPGGPGFEQYIGQAQLLCERDEFCGADFSAGDAYIAWVAQQHDSTGNPTTWIQAAVNHHITLAARQATKLLAA